MCHDRIMIMSGNDHVSMIEIPAEINAAEDYKKLTKLLVGTLYNLTKEREKTNQLLEDILQRVKKLEGSTKSDEKVLLSKVDEDILSYVRKFGKVCASDIQKNLNYRGKNAASSRLNRLYSKGILEKGQAGRTVYYLLKDNYQR